MRKGCASETGKEGDGTNSGGKRSNSTPEERHHSVAEPQPNQERLTTEDTENTEKNPSILFANATPCSLSGYESLYAVQGSRDE